MNNQPLHTDPRAASLLDLILGFIEVTRCDNNNQEPQNSYCSTQESRAFWRRLGVASSCFGNNSSNSTSNSTTINSVDHVFAIIKVIEHLLTASQEIAATASVMTQRDIYYSFVEQLPRRDQTVVNRAIDSISRFARTPRHELGVFASTRGFVAGSLVLGTVNVAALAGTQGMAIPGEFAALPDADGGDENNNSSDNNRVNISSNARCILVVEKDSVFQALVGARLWERYPMILITGRGFGDVATRVLLSRLASWLSSSKNGTNGNNSNGTVPVYGLADYNPAGLRILSVYRFGSQQQQKDNGNNATAAAGTATTNANNIVSTCPTLRWLGARAADRALVDPAQTTPLTPRDRALAQGLERELSLKIKAIENGNSSNNNRSGEATSLTEWKQEIAAMVAGGVRYDLEAIPDLPTFVLRKVVSGDAV